MELKIKDSLESIKIYGRYLSEFLLPDQIDILAKSLQKDIEQKLTLTDVGCSLPDKEEMNVEGLKGFKEMLKEDAATSKYDYSKGFINCFDWLSDKLRK